MKSLRSLYKIGYGPSSSHTLGPRRAAQEFQQAHPEADAFRVTLFGSLALTGEGHGTDRAVLSVVPDAQIVFNMTDFAGLPHPNTMLFEALEYCEETKLFNVSAAQRVFSIGGGEIQWEGEPVPEELDVYPENHLSEIIEICQRDGITLAEYVYRTEGPGIRTYLETVWDTMKRCVRRGLIAEGVLPGGLEIERKAKMLKSMRCYNEDPIIANDRIMCAYAYAVAEENAGCNEIVTAPTCGSAGVVPAVFYLMMTKRGFPEPEIIDALAVAGLIGNVIRTNASISGAECGCQAEIGSACSMAAAGLASLWGLSLEQIEYSAEVAMEHHLGLTCDPVKGLVQIPCIERNAVAAMRAVNSVNLARFLYGTRRISFDDVVDTMYRTGKDLLDTYRETSHGGLAALYFAGE